MERLHRGLQGAEAGIDAGQGIALRGEIALLLLPQAFGSARRIQDLVHHGGDIDAGSRSRRALVHTQAVEIQTCARHASPS